MDFDAASFANSWVDAWNAHDLNAVLSHFAEDAIFSSPVASQMLPETGGVLEGKDAIRAIGRSVCSASPTCGSPLSRCTSA